VQNAAGQSLRIHLEGSKTGVWSDFTTGEKGGSLLDLWMAVRKCDFRQAITEAKDWLGVKDEREDWRRTTASAPPRTPSPSLAAELVPVVEGSPVWKWSEKFYNVNFSPLVTTQQVNTNLHRVSRNCRTKSTTHTTQCNCLYSE
jgi:hypothetical protein